MWLPPVYSKKIIVILFLLSLCFFLLACTCLIGVYPVIVRNGVYSHVQLIKDTVQFDRFRELPFPFLFKVHFFNVTNSEDILKGKKPILREVGPYVYNEYRKKAIRSINEATDTITYRERQNFKFNQDESGDLSDEDEITVANAAYIGLVQKAEALGMDQILGRCLHDIMGDYNSPFITIKVKDLLFNGMNYFKSKNKSNWFDYLDVCFLIWGPVRAEAEQLQNNEKQDDGSLNFSLFNYKNRSQDGVFTVKRGIQNITNLGEIVKYNGYSKISNWKTNSICNQVKGTDSTIFPPTVTESSVLTIFSTDICRTVDMFYVKETRFKKIKVYQFEPSNITLNSNKMNKRDDCYCSEMTKDLDGNESCFLDGVLDVQPCIGAPVIVSFPHFLHAEKYLKFVEGLKPDKDLHNNVLLVEPVTGIPLKGGKRVQLNLVIRPIRSIKSLKDVSRSLLPIVWIDENVEVPDRLVEEMNEKLFNVLYYITIFLWSFLGLTVGSSFVYVFIIIFL